MTDSKDRFSRELAQYSIAQAPAGVFWTRYTGSVFQANHRFCELLGYAEEQLRALHICDIVTDWPKSRWPEQWGLFRKQDIVRYEGGLTTRLGDVTPVEISATLLRYGDEEVLCGFVQDGAPRQTGAEALMAELKASVDRFRILYNNAPIMLQACDFETRIFSVNQYWLQTMGYQWEEVIGRQTLEFMTAATRERSTREVLPVLRRSGSIHDFEYQFVKKNGEVIDLALTAVSDLEEDGRIVRTLSMLLPIADRKRAERLASQNVYLREELTGEFISGEIIGACAPIQEVFKNIELVAGTDSTVLLLGETGTGKELVARAIHKASRRKDGVMVKINCGALPSGLVENELFGHEKGAFTGAAARQKGRFELADKSTIFLDEIGELPLETQTKLLRVLQDQELERVGGAETIKVDVRVIAATNRDLAAEVERGRFRADLFYRLNIFPIRIPPLRERIDDVPLLSDFFVKKFAARMGKKITRIHRQAIEKLMAWTWPGNVRELANILERAVILCAGSELQTRHIGLDGGRVAHEAEIPTLEESERRLILKALEKCKGRLAGPKGAAVLLGINRSTLWSRMQKLGISKETPMLHKKDGL
jgi:formate hydrogenlyase transcriptional activator